MSLSSLPAATGGLHPAAGAGKCFLCHYNGAWSKGKTSHSRSGYRRDNIQNMLGKEIKCKHCEIKKETHKYRQCFFETSNIFLRSSSHGSVKAIGPGRAMGL